MTFGGWQEDVLMPRTDTAKRGASPHQRRLVPEHPERFRPDDIVRVGDDRLVGTGKFFYGVEIQTALNECVRVESVNDDGSLTVGRGFGKNPAQRIRRGDRLYIVAAAFPSLCPPSEETA